MSNFIQRHIGLSDQDIQDTLSILGYSSMHKFIADSLPEDISIESFDWQAMQKIQAQDEHQMLEEAQTILNKNTTKKSLLGLGYYGSITPSPIKRYFFENPGWYTAYTPYQSEIAQGRLELLMHFQTMCCELTGMDVANASLLDESSSIVEAVLVLARGKRQLKVLLDKDLAPQHLSMAEHRLGCLDSIDYEVGDVELENPEFDIVLAAYSSKNGRLRSLQNLTAKLQDKQQMVLVADIMQLVFLESPQNYEAIKIVVGSTQRFGIPLFAGGPHAAFMACRDGLKRNLPGRIVGLSKDRNNKPAYRLSLQTREQHIRRDKATSNICTAQVLLAIGACLYAIYHGKNGIAAISASIHHKARQFAESIQAKYPLVHTEFFDSLELAMPEADAKEYVQQAQEAGYNLRLTERGVCLSFDETLDEKDIAVLLKLAGGDGQQTLEDSLPAISPRNLDGILNHPVFHNYTSEMKFMRFLKKLRDKDIALDRSMIALGSCTMKLNSASEMEAVTWPKNANLHPFAPISQLAGSLEIANSLQEQLEAITGFDTVCLQPNSGATGELASLLSFRAYHQANGQNKDICLIPISAHGTNPASAILAGFEAVALRCLESGDIDYAHLEELLQKYTGRIGALMITYPSTFGIFVPKLGSLIERIHQEGGLVYVDGANMNALMGLVRPGELGVDAMHLNLHKTFCIPHGGGGPGVGAIGVAQHLKEFLPHYQANAYGGEQRANVASAPYGSAGIFVISWAYIKMMGFEGLRKGTEVAILNANYMLHKLKKWYKCRYTNDKGLVAHEMIVDLSELKSIGLSAEDVAKRLIDFGFHAPTLSFPVPEVLMIEPTESESLEEMDNFIEAMRCIALEIEEVRSGAIAAEASPLKNAPHSPEDIINWQHSYPLQKGVFPNGAKDKYFSPVARIDNVYGDRNLICSCPQLVIEE